MDAYVKGKLELADIIIEFTIDEYNLCNADITSTLDDCTEHITCEGHKFMKALAIAVHYDGMPDYKVDYPDAESIQGVIRWIP